MQEKSFGTSNFLLPSHIQCCTVNQNFLTEGNILSIFDVYAYVRFVKKVGKCQQLFVNPAFSIVAACLFFNMSSTSVLLYVLPTSNSHVFSTTSTLVPKNSQKCRVSVVAAPTRRDARFWMVLSSAFPEPKLAMKRCECGRGRREVGVEMAMAGGSD